MIAAVVAFQMNGFGSSFQAEAQVVIASVSSGTLVKAPRRSRLSVSSLNQRSMRFSQELDVGVKRRCHRRRSRCANQVVISGALWAERLSSTTWTASPLGHAGVDLLEEPQHVLGGVALAAVRQDLAGREIHRGEQIGGAVALVVVGHRGGAAPNHRQARLGPVHCLTLGLLIEAEHHRPTRWVEVETDDVDRRILKVWVVRELESLDPPGFEVVIGPDPGHRVLADPEPLRQRPRRPVRRAVSGFLAAGDTDNLSDHCLGQSGFAAASLRDHPDPNGALLREASTPPPHRVRVDLRPASDLLIGHPVSGPQQRLRLHHIAVRQRRRGRHPLQLSPLRLGHLQRRRYRHWHNTTLPHYFTDRALAAIQVLDRIPESGRHHSGR